MQLVIRALACTLIAVSATAAQQPGPGAVPRPPAVAVRALDERELDEVLERFLQPEKFEDAQHYAIEIRKQAGIALAQQLGLQTRPPLAQRIVDSLVDAAGAPDTEVIGDGELRLAIAQALGPLDDPKLQSSLVTALRKQSIARPGYLNRSFTLRLLSEWRRRAAFPVHSDPLVRDWVQKLSADDDFRLSLQAWKLTLENATNGELWALYSAATAPPKSSHRAQIENLILREVTARAALLPRLRESFSSELFADARRHWTSRREAWLTWLELTPNFDAPANWSAKEGNPFLKRLFRQRRGPATPSDAPGETRAPTFFRMPVDTQRAVFVIDQSSSMHAECTLANGKTVVPSKLVEQQFADYLEQLGPKPAEHGLQSLSVIFFGERVDETLVLVDEGHWIGSGVERLGREWGRERGNTNVYGALVAAFRDTDADTLVLFSDGDATRGVYAWPEALVEEVRAWNEGRGTRVVTLSAKPSPAAAPRAQRSTSELLTDATDGVQLYLEDCFH